MRQTYGETDIWNYRAATLLKVQTLLFACDGACAKISCSLDLRIFHIPAQTLGAMLDKWTFKVMGPSIIINEGNIIVKIWIEW